MSLPLSGRGPGRAFARSGRLLLVALVALSGAGCALFHGMDKAPNGLSKDDDELRRMLAGGRYGQAWEHLRDDDDARPADDLLGLMYDGIVAYYAGSYDSSLVALDQAEQVAQDRVTKSISRAALSTVTNDLILPYEPGSSERLLIHYYGLMAGLRSGDADAAAVEARRLSHLLDQTAAEGDTTRAARRRLDAMLNYLSGVAFEKAGEHDDADVSYRRAEALAPSLAAPPAAPAPDSGDVVFVVEQGFVAHLAEQSVWLFLTPEEVETFESGSAGEKVALSALVAAQAALEIAVAADPERHHSSGPPYRDDHPHRRVYYSDADDSDELPYLLEVAWPVFRQDGVIGGAPRLVVPGDSAFAPLALDFRADVSRAVESDYAEERGAILGRTVLRAVSRFALSKAAEKKADEKSDGLGRVVGVLFNIGSVVLERADTRSWHLLPRELGVARVRLPAGTYPVQAVWDAMGGGSAGRQVGLGTVEVKPGGVTVLSGRIWR